MPSRLPTASRGLAPALLFLATLAFAGCASSPADRPPEKRRTPAEQVPTLSGQAAFFDRQITAEVTIGVMERSERKDERVGEGWHKRRHPGPPRTEGDGLPKGGIRHSAPSGPPVMIHLRFTNHGREPVELRIADFLSPLGNFVVHPEKLTLAPGASAEVEPMTSGLAGQVTGGEVTLKLQLGDRRENKVVPLQIETKSGPESGKSGQTL